MALEIINDPEKYEKQKQDLAEVVSQLGEPGAHERVAQIVTELLDMPSQG
jgi:hypothetical protein